MKIGYVRCAIALGAALALTAGCGGDGGAPSAQERADASPKESKIMIVADDMSFPSIQPSTVKAGPVVSTLKNVGKAPHQAGYYLLRPGVEFGDYVDAILKDDAAIPELSTSSSYGVLRPYTGPGEEQSQRAPNLEAGTYAVLCFVIDSETGKNHYEMGMIGKLEVLE